ncbi:hypothetical protein AAG570_007950, partial [Ranatra chinensis]
HHHHLAQTKEREPDVVLIGDSLIHHLQLRPIWNELFEPLHCLNFGISGDCTQHVLWRIQNGELDNIEPKVVVLLVGTNNYGSSPEEIADGIREIVIAIRQHLPNAYIVVIELLPRGQYPNPLRDRNKSVNNLLKHKLAGLEKVETVSAEKGLIQADGTISHHDMPDFLHLSDIGYRKAFEPLYDLLTQLLYEHEKEKDLTPSE